MKRALKVIFLFCITVSYGQNVVESKFLFTSSSTSEIGNRVTVINPDLWGIYLCNSTHDDSAKLVVGEEGILFLNKQLTTSIVVWDPADESQVLYQDQGRYWIFRKKDAGAKLFSLYEIHLVHKTGVPKTGFINEASLLTETDVEDFLADCKSDGIKARTKDNIIYLDSLNDLFFSFYKQSPKRLILNQDPSLDVVIESLECSPGKDQKWLDSAQYDVMKLDVALKDQHGNPVDGFLVIDKTGIFMSAEGRGSQAHYLYKRDDENYAFQKVDGGYLMFQKLPSGYYDMVMITLKGTKAQLFEIKRESHSFFSLTKNKVVNGIVTYFICDELAKYLLYGKASMGDYTGSKFHW